MKIAIFNADGTWFTNSIKGDDGWSPPAGMIAVEGVEGKPGDKWDGKKLVSPKVIVEPIQVTTLQMLLTLQNEGLLDQVNTIVKEHPLKEIQIWFEKATHWNESDSYVQAIILELDITAKKAHELFVSASLK